MEHRHLDGMKYFHNASYGSGLLYADTERNALIFHGFNDRKVSISLDSVADAMVMSSRAFSKKSKTALEKLWAEFTCQNQDEPKHSRSNLINPAKAKPENSTLCRKVERHIDLLLDREMEDIPLFLQKLNAECLGVECAKKIQRRIRQTHPSGISKRPTKRIKILREIETSINNSIKEWWLNIRSHSPEMILAHIGDVPEQHVDGVISKMITIPYSCYADCSSKVWDFYELHFDHLLLCLGQVPAESIGTSILSYASLLTCKHGIEYRIQLFRLIKILTDNTPTEFRILIGFSKFLCKNPPSISGKTRFDELTEIDFFLAACYHSDHRIVSGLSNWTLNNIKNNLDERNYNSFLVRGIQPRIAELAFAEIYSRMYKSESLVDLNAEFSASLHELKPTKDLPSADWKNESGMLFDVKSNLHFRSQSEHTGLRGFMIKRPENHDISYYGIVIHQTSNDCCDWLGVGMYSRECAEELGHSSRISDERTIPFLFALPEQCRFKVDLTDDQFQCIMALLTDQKMRLAWALAAGRQPSIPTSASKTMRSLINYLSLKSHLPFEFRLWRALTEATLEGCSNQQLDDVKRMLDEAVSWLRNGLLPVRLAQIEGITLIEKWIQSILRPITTHFHQIRCPNCGSRDFLLKLKHVTSGGAIYGTMECKGDCQQVHDSITILTHCHKCRKYPIILGKNEVCRKCYGLICDHRRNDQRCGACKTGCAEIEG